MWEMLQAVEARACQLNGLLDTLVGDDSEQKYSEAVSLLTDLTRLVDAGVFSMERIDAG